MKRKKEAWTLQDLATKIDYEGGIGEALKYFGPDLPTDNEELLDLWKTAYDVVEQIKDILPEPEYD